MNNPSSSQETPEESPHPSHFRRVVAALAEHPGWLFLLWALWLGAEYFVFGPNSYVRIHDNADANLPARMATAAALRDGTLGYWAPQWVAGTDRFAQGLTNDLTLLPFVVLPGWVAYALIMLVQRFLAGYFTFRLMRDDLGARRGAAIYAGLFFAMFAQYGLNRDWAGFTLYSGFGLPATALVLWLLPRIAPRGWAALPLALLLGAAFGASGSVIMTLFVVALAFFWFCLIVPQRSPRFWGLLVLFAVAWAAVTFVQLYPTLKMGPISNRAHWNVAPIWSVKSRMVEAARVVADNFVPLLLGAIGVLVVRRKDRRLLAIAAAIVFCVLMHAFYYGVAGYLRPFMGFLYGFNWERFNLLIPFLAVTAAALAVSDMPGWHWRGARMTTVVLGVACVLVFLQSVRIKTRTVGEMLAGATYRSLFRNPALAPVLAAEAAAPHSFRVATISLGNTDPPWPPGAVWAYGLDSADGYLSVQTERYQDFWEKVIAPLTAHDPGRYDWMHSWGNQAYLFSPTRGFPPGPVPFDRYYRLDLLTLVGVRYIISPVPLVHPDLVLVNANVVAKQLPWWQLGRVHRLRDLLLQRAQGLPLYVYENRQTPVPLVSCPPAGRVITTSMTPDRDELEVLSDTPCTLTVISSFSPFWKATVDGDPVPITPQAEAFEAIAIPSGTHHVTLRYQPPY